MASVSKLRTKSNKMLCTVTVVCSLLVAAQVQGKSTPKSAHQLMQQAKEHCSKETKATPEQAKILYNHAEIPKDDVERCYMQCIYSTIGLVKDGKIDQQGAHKIADMLLKNEDNNLAKKVIDDCAKSVTPKEGEKCSLGRAIRECWFNASQQIEFVPGF